MHRLTKAALLAVFCSSYWTAFHNVPSHKLALRRATEDVSSAACDYEVTDAQWNNALATISYVH